MHSMRLFSCRPITRGGPIKLPPQYQCIKPIQSRLTVPRRTIYQDRHIGPNNFDIKDMLRVIGKDNNENLDDLSKRVIPNNLMKDIKVCKPISEVELSQEFKRLASENKIDKTYLGNGYYGTNMPSVIRRNIMESSNWITPYSPYQSEIAQGTLEALYNYQKVVAELTDLPIANSSLLDEPSAGAEAMIMAYNYHNKTKKKIIIDSGTFDQTKNVMRSFAEPLGIEIVIKNFKEIEGLSSEDLKDVCGVLIQYPNITGELQTFREYKGIGDNIKKNGSAYIMACDLLALTMLESPGFIGADIAFGNSQRFGVPMFNGGPHAAFISTREKYMRFLPGKMVGKSIDTMDNIVYRMALQTREQHIKRDKATSNICTAQCFLATLAGMYAVYHGPNGLKKIAQRVHTLANMLKVNFERSGYKVSANFFDTVHVADCMPIENCFKYMKRNDGYTISIDETTTIEDIQEILKDFDINTFVNIESISIHPSMMRTNNYMEQPIFNTHKSETEFLRYIHTLGKKNISLTDSMFPLGSCTMKLNSSVSMECMSNEGFSNIHPYIDKSFVPGYTKVFGELRDFLKSISGLDEVCLQPNAGSQGEYVGLRIIKKYLDTSGERRDICLIPGSAHGTNSATAIRAGLTVVQIKNDQRTGKIDMQDLSKKCSEYFDRLAAIMITYPSTYGFFEDNIVDICNIIHSHGGQVYLDGANMNAQVGLCNLSDHVDVMHFNLHKTFSIPHGGGGPGAGCVALKSHLAPYLPCEPLKENFGDSIGPIAGSYTGSSGILPISWGTIKMLGTDGLKKCSQIAILNANYMASKLQDFWDIMFTNDRGYVSHEFIVSTSPFLKHGIKANDIVKRLQDYSFHAPTVSWPVPNSLMIEPTESESKAELDRFCEAMINIRKEIRKIEDGIYDKHDNPIKNAPHPIASIATDLWPHKYTREEAVYPLPYLQERKFWPPCSRVDEVYGDKILYEKIRNSE